MLKIHNSLLAGLLGLSSLLTSTALPVSHSLSHARATYSDPLVEANNLAQGPDAITSANWRQHPKIKAVRSVVESVTAGLSKGLFKVSQREFEYCEPYEDTLRKIAFDAKETVLYYEKQGGSEDSSLTFNHYYDEAGRLRFVFIKGGATSGSKLEHRIYSFESHTQPKLV